MCHFGVELEEAQQALLSAQTRLLAAEQDREQAAERKLESRGEMIQTDARTHALAQHARQLIRHRSRERGCSRRDAAVSE